MYTVKCKFCGGDIEFAPGSRVVTCDCCGAKLELAFSEKDASAEADAKPAEAKSGEEQKTQVKGKARKKSRKVWAIVAAVVLVGVIAGVALILLPKKEPKKPLIDINTTNVGDTIQFGHYDDVNEWIVLDRKDDSLLLLSKHAICRSVYHEEHEDVTWSTCSLRKWLNTDYLAQAFSEEERELIADTQVHNADNPVRGTPGGDDTVDQVFLLSIEEAEKYFDESDDTGVTLTDGKKVWCWLRSPGGRSISAAFDYSSGAVNRIGEYVYNDVCAVRPALWVNLKP